jgi:hypothetical protein
MSNFINQPPLSGNLKFDICPGIGMTADVAKLPPKLIIVISLGLLVIGLYQYYQKIQEKENKSV